MLAAVKEQVLEDRTKTMLSGMMMLIGLLVAAGPASADKPARGCPDGFTSFTSAQIFEMFPE